MGKIKTTVLFIGLCFHLAAWAADNKIFSFPLHNIDNLKPIKDSSYLAQRKYYQLKYGNALRTYITLSVNIDRLDETQQAQMRYVLEFWDGQSETFSNEIYHFKVEHGSSGGDYRVEVKNHQYDREAKPEFVRSQQIIEETQKLKSDFPEQSNYVEAIYYQAYKAMGASEYLCSVRYCIFIFPESSKLPKAKEVEQKGLNHSVERVETEGVKRIVTKTIMSNLVPYLHHSVEGALNYLPVETLEKFNIQPNSWEKYLFEHKNTQPAPKS